MTHVNFCGKKQNYLSKVAHMFPLAEKKLANRQRIGKQMAWGAGHCPGDLHKKKSRKQNDIGSVSNVKPDPYPNMHPGWSRKCSRKTKIDRQVETCD